MRTLTTDRLILRPFRPDDEAIHQLVFADPDVARAWAGGTRSPSRAGGTGAARRRTTRLGARQQPLGPRSQEVELQEAPWCYGSFTCVACESHQRSTSSTASQSRHRISSSSISHVAVWSPRKTR
jgi:hypothetical protein